MKKRLKEPYQVLFLTRLYVPHTGGVEKHVSRVAAALRDQGVTVTILTHAHLPDFAAEEVIDGIRVVRIPWCTPVNTKLTVWKFISEHREMFQSTDIVHVHDVCWWLVPVLPSVFTKFFITFHGWEGVYPPTWKSIVQRRIWSKLSRGSIHVGAYIQRWYQSTPNLVTYGGVDEVFSLENNNEKRLRQTKYLRFIGRLDSANDIDQMIRVFQLCRREYPQLRCQWVGDGAARVRCAAVGEVLGWVSDPSGLICQSDIVIANSYLSIMEAQVQGKPVIAYASHALKRDYLALYPAADALFLCDTTQECLSHIQTLLVDPAAKNTARSCAVGWLKTQTWLHLANQYQKLWGR